jgi:hypothetical protein
VDCALATRIGHVDVAMIQPNDNALEVAQRHANFGASAQIGDPSLLFDSEAQGRDRDFMKCRGRFEPTAVDANGP